MESAAAAAVPPTSTPANNADAAATNLELSAATLVTLQKIRERPLRNASKKNPLSKSNYFDNTAKRLFGWLPNAWVAEQRRMPTGRVYTYYYDPSGRQYRSRQEVFYTLKEAGYVVVDI